MRRRFRPVNMTRWMVCRGHLMAEWFMCREPTANPRSGSLMQTAQRGNNLLSIVTQRAGCQFRLMDATLYLLPSGPTFPIFGEWILAAVMNFNYPGDARMGRLR